MRSIFAASLLLAILIGTGTAGAAGCPPGALGIERTIVVDPNEHVRLGSMQYAESLPLKDREVVLTFDDGPLPPYTDRILDTLASECVKATFFMVGRMARAYPSLVQRIHDDGHTVASHSQNHPFSFHTMTVGQAAREIEDGFASLRSVLDDPRAVAPFFRIPGLLRQDSVEAYLAAHGYMTWSVDFHADDWTRISSHEIARRAIGRLESRGKGILLLHDIQPATALAMPEILRELKARGFKIVHVVPAAADRPKTVTRPEQWVVRRTPEQKEKEVWPRTLAATVDGARPVLSAPSPANFGIENFGGRSIKVALAHNLERRVVRDDGAPASPLVNWPARIAYSVPAEIDALPVPGAHNFRYSRPFRIGATEKPKLAARKPAPTASNRPLPLLGGIFFLPAHRPRAVGPHFPVARPPGHVSGSRPPGQATGSRPQNQTNVTQPPSDAHSAQAR
jgi:peptidoglycan/xylan/chitin deacetylase (PgdA/CDA1 family)